jgi:hypothetical protein
MKAFLFAFVLLGAAAVAPLSAQVLASWNFDADTISGSSANFGPLAADTGSGSATGHHASAASTWSAPVGNASAKSFSVNTWAVGDYFQFQTSAASSSSLSVSWDQTGSSTGPKDFGLFYSTDGINFTQFGSNYSILVNAAPNSPWTGSGSRNSAYTFSDDLSSITALNNSPAVYFRLTDESTIALNGGTVATAGTDRVDNFTISAIPEPSTYALLAGFAVLGFAALRRKRTAVSA